MEKINEKINLSVQLICTNLSVYMCVCRVEAMYSLLEVDQAKSCKAAGNSRQAGS